MRSQPEYLVEVALGRLPADLYIENARVLNVYSGEILTGSGVAIAAGRVAYVGAARGMIGSETGIIDADGGILVPGYIDPHAHFDLIVSLRRIAEVVLPLGTTTIINDTLAMVTRFGAAGLSYLRAAAERLPLHVYFTVTASGVAPELEEKGYPAGVQLTESELVSALSDERVLGTGECPPWRRLLDGDPRLLDRLGLARARGKLRSGHNPGARADHIQALAAAGLTDCHEALTSGEALDRLRAGMYVILRHGPARSDLPVLAPLVLQEGVDRSRLMLTPDWVPPGDLTKTGHMNHVISTALEQGVPPVEAYRMATVNPARYLRIEEQVGAIAPGRHADILCLDSLLQPTPRWVIVKGEPAARDGQVITDRLPQGIEPQLPPYRPSVAVASAADFQVRAGKMGEVVVPAIKIIDQTVTGRVDLRLPVRNGFAVPPEGGQVLKMAMPRPEGGFAVRFLTGLGALRGALGSSAASSPYHTLVIGSNDEDMAISYNRMVRQGGGVVAVQQGRIEAELPLPVGGFISTAPVQAVANDIDAVNRWARKHGCPFEDIFLIQRYFTYVGVPFFRMTPWGIYDVKENLFLQEVIDG